MASRGEKRGRREVGEGKGKESWAVERVSVMRLRACSGNGGNRY